MNLYFDNASTSYPKPAAVGEAIARYLAQCGGTYGRGFYPRARQATALVEECRDRLGQIMGVDGGRVFFTANATWAANLALKGLPLSGRTVLVSGMEHNAVMRPLHHLWQACGVKICLLPSLGDGTVDAEQITPQVLADAALIVLNHQGNVNGATQPVGRIMEKAGDVPVMLDAAQSLTAAGLPGFGAGERRPDYIVFTGHKGLYGPTGTGGLYAADPAALAPLLHGGTGSNSDSYLMPQVHPDRLEAGTPNTTGIAGLLAALNDPPPGAHGRGDLRRLMDRIAALEEITLYRASSFERQGETFGMTHSELSAPQFAELLFSQYGIETRQGLHCAPLAHRTLGTFPSGSVRVSLSHYHTPEDMDYLARAVEKLCGR